MSSNLPVKFAALWAALAISCAGQTFDRTLKIPLPGRNASEPTQKLNREGVAELKHGHREKAKKLFYRAYLLDPQDPFTLNNLGYIAELDGDADRALKYYALAAKDPTDAIITQSSDPALKGKPLAAAFEQVQTADQQLSKLNEQSVVLMEHGEVFAALNLLRSSMPQHPDDPFLLNNMGYALESVGDLDGALRAYSAAASVRSNRKVIVTPREKWRGRPISEVAAANAAAISEQIAKGEGAEASAARLNLRGVAALNDNHPAQAKEFFLQAYQKDPDNAFTLNNLGYLSEMGGDWETAQVYYTAARSGHDAKGKVSYSTRREAEGQKLDSLAVDNQSGVENTLEAMQAARRRGTSPSVGLIRRDNSPRGIPENNTPAAPIGVQPPPMPALPAPGAKEATPPANEPHPDDDRTPQNPNLR